MIHKKWLQLTTHLLSLNGLTTKLYNSHLDEKYPSHYYFNILNPTILLLRLWHKLSTISIKIYTTENCKSLASLLFLLPHKSVNIFVSAAFNAIWIAWHIFIMWMTPHMENPCHHNLHHSLYALSIKSLSMIIYQNNVLIVCTIIISLSLPLSTLESTTYRSNSMHILLRVINITLELISAR